MNKFLITAIMIIMFLLGNTVGIIMFDVGNHLNMNYRINKDTVCINKEYLIENNMAKYNDKTAQFELLLFKENLDN